MRTAPLTTKMAKSTWTKQITMMLQHTILKKSFTFLLNTQISSKAGTLLGLCQKFSIGVDIAVDIGQCLESFLLVTA